MTCAREDELLDALAAGYVSPDLATHVAACAACGELRAVAGALIDDRVTAIQNAAVPSSAAMWWRTQTRYRRDVETAARRSLIAGQAMTLAIAVALVALFFGAGISEAAHRAIAVVRSSTPLLVTFVLTLVAAPLAGVVALRR